MNLLTDPNLFARRLLDWYQENRRDLPFRKTRDPYRIWISEIMAQQTRISAMLPYYERFLVHFPDVEALSNAKEDELMACWQGLGYYSRARNLQAAARQIMQDYEGRFPLDKQELLKLKGIGDYTAGAISSIAGGKRAAAIDGNVVRVFCRLSDFEDDTTKSAAKRKIADMVEQTLPEANLCGGFNQALMELGALVCTPKAAHCESCPISSFCEARKNGTQLQRPVRKKKKERPVEKREVWITVRPYSVSAPDGGHMKDAEIRIRKRTEKGLLHGLYEFDSRRPKEADVFGAKIESLGSHRHIFSHREWEMDGFLLLLPQEQNLNANREEVPAAALKAKSRGKEQTSALEDAFFVRLGEAGSRYAIASAFAPFLKRAVVLLDESRTDAKDKTVNINTGVNANNTNEQKAERTDLKNWPKEADEEHGREKTKA